MKVTIKSKTITEILGDYIPTDSNDAFSISIKDIEGNIIMEYTSEETIEHMLEKFSDWSYVYNSTTTRYTADNPLHSLIRTFVYYKVNNADNWTRIATAYTAKYNPIHNYDRTESSTTSHTFNETGTNNTTATATNTQLTPDISTLKYGDNENSGVKTTNTSTTYDNQNPFETTASTTTGSQTNTNTMGTRKNDSSADGNYNRNYSDNNIYNSETSGNIGVTKTTDMIESEIKLRNFEYLDYILDNFASRYLVYFPLEDDFDDCYFL